MDNSGIKIKSLAKALRVLECFKNHADLGVTEISEMLGLNKSNVCDILTTFETLGYVEQSRRTEKYRLGYKVLELSHALSSSLGFRKSAYPHMKKLADDVNETVYLGVPDGLDVVYLDAAYPHKEYMTRSMLGDRAPMYCTGIGKAMLSHMDEKLWQQLNKIELEPFTTSTITNPCQLMDELRLARKRGYAVDNMEHEHGIRCVGVPIISDGIIKAGISISCPSLRLDDETVEIYAQRLQEVAKIMNIYF